MRITFSSCWLTVSFETLLYRDPSLSKPFFIGTLLYRNPSLSKPFFIETLLYRNPSLSKPFFIETLLYRNPSLSKPYSSRLFFIKPSFIGALWIIIIVPKCLVELTGSSLKLFRTRFLDCGRVLSQIALNNNWYIDQEWHLKSIIWTGYSHSRNRVHEYAVDKSCFAKVRNTSTENRYLIGLHAQLSHRITTKLVEKNINDWMTIRSIS
jgi:hypothetical protein